MDGVNEITITVDGEFLIEVGSGSLVGAIMIRNNMKFPEKLTLQFPQTTIQWKRDHGGPDEFIVLEHNIPCLLEDVLFLISSGVKIIVTMPETKSDEE